MRTIWYKTAINEAMHEEMARDQRVFLIGEDVDLFGGVFKISRGLLERFGARRVRGTPISESAFVGLAAGAAMAGLRPIVEMMYVDFALVAMDQLVNQAASTSYMSGGRVRLPLVVRGQYGTGTCEAAQHSRNFESWFINTPGYKVVMPATAYDAKGLLKSAIRDENPVLYLENRVLYTRKEEVPEGEWLVPIGSADVKRPGTDITVVATGCAVHKALEAARQLAGKVDVEVLDPRTLDPLDLPAVLASVRKTGNLLAVQEAPVQCSFASELIRLVAQEAFGDLEHAPLALGAADLPVPFSPVLEKAAIPQAEDIVAAVQRVLGASP